MKQDLPLARTPNRVAWVRCPWRIGLALLALILILGGTGLAQRTYFLNAAENRFQGAMAEADRLDPGWRWEEVLANQTMVAEAENSARRVLATAALLPRAPANRSDDLLHETASLNDELDKIAPTHRLPEALAKELSEVLARVEPAVEEARGLAAMPRGRYDVAWSPNLPTTKVPHLLQARAVARLLQFDAILATQDGDLKRALASCAASFNAGRSINEEPLGISLLVRNACTLQAVATIERVLAQGEVSDQELANWQALLDTESNNTCLLTSLRGERAAFTALLGRIYTGEGSFSSFNREPPQPPEGLERIRHWAYVAALARLRQAAFLELMTEAVEIAKLEPGERQKAWDAFDMKLQTLHQSSPRLAVVVEMVQEIKKVAKAQHRCIAVLRCARAAMAAERFRMAHAHWPGTLRDLTPRFLGEIPKDPFREGSLLSRRFDDRFIVYSVGPNRTDDSGSVDLEPGQQQSLDIGFRLWDVDKRRQPPSVQEKRGRDSK